MSDIWREQNTSNSAWVKLAFERNVKDQGIAERNATLLLLLLCCRSSCSTYLTYKDQFELENYLVRLSQQERISLCKFRTGDHRLPIVTSRYNSTQREIRFYTKCEENEIGDEYHVLFVCKNQETLSLRNQFTPMYYKSSPNQFKFVQLFQDSRYGIQNYLGRFTRAVNKLF